MSLSCLGRATIPDEFSQILLTRHQPVNSRPPLCARTAVEGLERHQVNSLPEQRDPDPGILGEAVPFGDMQRDRQLQLCIRASIHTHGHGRVLATRAGFPRKSGHLRRTPCATAPRTCSRASVRGCAGPRGAARRVRHETVAIVDEPRNLDVAAHLARSRPHQPCNRAQDGGLAAAGRTDERNELAGGADRTTLFSPP